jgi:transcriptional regulator
MGRTSESTDLLQGMLDLLILRTVADEPLHGYGLAQRLRLLSENRLRIPQGSLYPALHRLEHKGFLKGVWQAGPTGRDAKYYQLTPKGRRRLEMEVREWNTLSTAISLILRPA